MECHAVCGFVPIARDRVGCPRHPEAGQGGPVATEPICDASHIGSVATGTPRMGGRSYGVGKGPRYDDVTTASYHPDVLLS